MNNSTISGAEAVIRSLLAENVSTIFGYPGGAIMPIYDALFDFKGRFTLHKALQELREKLGLYLPLLVREQPI